MRTLTTTLFAAIFIALSLQAGTRPPAVQSGPYSWDSGTYQYDAAGNIIAIGTHTFTYDALSRLSTAHVTAPGAVSDQTYTYDVFGNMIERTTSGVPTSMPAGLDTNHLDPGIALAYDDAGEITQFHPPGSANTYGFTYDALGSVSAETVGGVTTSYFVYTADDERLRVEKPVNNKKHWRVRNLDNKVLRDVLLSGSTLSVYRDYVYRGGSLLEAITPTTVEHFSLDHLGSPRLISDSVGNQISLHTYLPFGEEAGPAAADGEPMKFTGHERDDDPAGGTNQLDYMHARYYSSTSGRFLSIDPALDADRALHNPQSWNRYSYVENNPTNHTDPTGKLVEIVQTANVQRVKAFLVATMMRPTGRADLMTAIMDPNHKVRMTTANLNSLAQVQMNLKTKGSTPMTFGETLPTGNVQVQPNGTGRFVVTGSTMTIDTSAVTQHHSDQSGVTTTAHEFHHVNALRSGGVAQMKLGDVPTSATGPSEHHGQKVAAEKPDISHAAAQKLVDALVPVRP